jgi:hypothetical protein
MDSDAGFEGGLSEPEAHPEGVVRQDSRETPRTYETFVVAEGLARRATDRGDLTPISPHAVDRLARIRERLQARVYDSDAVRAAVARRIISSGDL